MAEQSSKPSRQRSPNYPSINLEEAIQRITTIYEQQRKNPADREVFAQILGYKGINGASVKVISSLSKYGLLEGSGGNLRVSSAGEDLALHRPGDAEYASAVQAAGNAPAFFRELAVEYPDGLPSDHAIRATLIKRGFHPQAVEPALQSYRETLDFMARFASPDTNNRRDQEEDENVSQGNARNASTASTQPVGHVSYSIPISPSRTVVISGPFPISSAEWQQFQKVLGAFEPALVSTEEGGEMDVRAESEHESGVTP